MGGSGKEEAEPRVPLLPLGSEGEFGRDQEITSDTLRLELRRATVWPLTTEIARSRLKFPIRFSRVNNTPIPNPRGWLSSPSALVNNEMDFDLSNIPRSEYTYTFTLQLGFELMPLRRSRLPPGRHVIMPQFPQVHCHQDVAKACGPRSVGRSVVGWNHE